MQSDTFWKDEHNIKMANLYDQMVGFRDNITENIKLHNAKVNAETRIQGINGFARVKNFLDINPKMNYWSEVSFREKQEYEYKFSLLKIYNLAREFKSKIGR